jgi:hypothetical protein
MVVAVKACTEANLAATNQVYISPINTQNQLELTMNLEAKYREILNAGVWLATFPIAQFFRLVKDWPWKPTSGQRVVIFKDLGLPSPTPGSQSAFRVCEGNGLWSLAASNEVVRKNRELNRRRTKGEKRKIKLIDLARLGNRSCLDAQQQLYMNQASIPK